MWPITAITGCSSINERTNPPHNTVANLVFGQGGRFTTNAGASGPNGLFAPFGVAFDSLGNLFVSDSQNSRVLKYHEAANPPTATTPDVVFGQAGSYANDTCNMGGAFPSADSLCFPLGVAVDTVNNLYIVDPPNNRVLGFNGPFIPIPTSTPTRTPTPTPTRKPTATPTAMPPVINRIPGVILVGGSFNVTGANFTAGSKANFFVATSGGAFNAGPLIPTAMSLPTQLTASVPANTTLGQGFVEVQVVNTDKGFAASNLAPALLQGSVAAGIPSLTSINGAGLAATSSNPAYAANNVETVVAQGSPVKLGGSGFDTVNGVAVDLFCACKGGKVGPFFINPGTAGLSSTSISFLLPASGTNAPKTGPGSFVVSNAGAPKAYSKKSNAVSVPIGQKISVTEVSQSGTTITVNGTAFSTRTVINFFNAQGGGAVNLGGLTSGGAPKIALGFVNSDQFTFTKPAGAMPGASYVQALNPPFVTFTSSGNGPGGALTLK